jgi:hypothetical protein
MKYSIWNEGEYGALVHAIAEINLSHHESREIKIITDHGKRKVITNQRNKEAQSQITKNKYTLNHFIIFRNSMARFDWQTRIM